MNVPAGLILTPAEGQFNEKEASFLEVSGPKSADWRKHVEAFVLVRYVYSVRRPLSIPCVGFNKKVHHGLTL